jgi:hypothetical protein
MPAAPAESAAPTPVCALPPRYWWLKRICALTLAWIVFLVAVRLWWGWEADRRWEATIARYRAAGQPVFRADFAAAPIPDEENAATYLRAAIDVMNRNRLPASLDGSYASATAALELSGEQTRQRQAAEQEILNLIRRARACEHAYWGDECDDLAITDLSGLRALARTVAGMMAYETDRGNGRAVVQRAHDMLSLAEQAGTHAPNLITGLVRLAIDALLCAKLQEALSLLRGGLVTATSDSEPVPASRAEIAALLHHMFNERSAQDHWLRQMHGERMQLLERAAGLCQGELHWTAFTYARASAPPVKPPLHLLIGPMWTLDGLRAAEMATTLGDALTARSMPVAYRLHPPVLPTTSTLRNLPHTFSLNLAPHMSERVLALVFRGLALRRMTATALAIRLYEADHGRRPARLADLVPDYLPAVPADPQSPDDRQICYLPNDDLPRLYSVGLNGVDDGGQYEFTPGGGIHPDSLDYPLFFLQGIPTPAPPPDPNHEVQTEPQRSN